MKKFKDVEQEEVYRFIDGFVKERRENIGYKNLKNNLLSLTKDLICEISANFDFKYIGTTFPVEGSFSDFNISWVNQKNENNAVNYNI